MSKVESIIGSRPDGFGKKEYLVKWVGTEIDQATWEPQNEFDLNYPDLVAAFV